MKKKLIIFAVCLIMTASMVLALTGCQPGITDATPEGIKAYGTLVVATNAAFEPFEYFDSRTQEIIGWDIEVAAKFAEMLGVKLQVDHMDFDAVLLAPSTNKAHISMAGISYSETRDRTLDFTTGIFDSTQVIIVKEDSAIKGPFDLEGKRVGAQNGTVGHLLAKMDEDWAYYEGEAVLGAPGSVQEYENGSLAVLALTQGKVDAVIIDKYPAENYVKNYAGVKIAEESVYDDEYAFAVKEGNKALVDWLNSAIAQLREEGFFDQLNEKYFGKKVTE